MCFQTEQNKTFFCLIEGSMPHSSILYSVSSTVCVTQQVINNLLNCTHLPVKVHKAPYGGPQVPRSPHLENLNNNQKAEEQRQLAAKCRLKFRRYHSPLSLGKSLHLSKPQVSYLWLRNTFPLRPPFRETGALRRDCFISGFYLTSSNLYL